MSADNRISAAEIRALGIDLGTGIPDCAHISRDSFHAALAHAMQDASYHVEGDVMTMDISITIVEPFQWIDISLMVSP